MKVVYAPTPEQEQMIADLINHLYSSVFPCYFTDEKITSFFDLNVLKMPRSFDDWLQTAEEGFQVIASLQVIVSLLETNCNTSNTEDFYEHLFEKNKLILASFGLSFPFTYDQFSNRIESHAVFSMYTPASNEHII